MYRVEKEIGSQKLVIETGTLAKQAAGSVIVRYEDNEVLVAVTTEAGREGGDMLPLMVDYRERYAASGKYPGGFIKREGRPSEKEILTMRLTDRPIRPLFPDWLRDEILIQGTVFSAGEQYDTDVLNIVGASTALMISSLPFLGPIGAVRVGFVDGEYIINPSYDQRKESRLDLVVAGTADAIMMVESSVSELTEDEMLDALDAAHAEIKKIVEMQHELLKVAGIELTEPVEPEMDAEFVKLQKEVHKYAKKVKKALSVNDKLLRKKNLKEIKNEILEKLVGDAELVTTFKEHKAFEKKTNFIKNEFEELVHLMIREVILKDKTRIDGRKSTEIRPIDINVHPFSYPHGSSIFTRGETQAAVSVALGTGDDEQIVESMQQDYKETFTVHYSFPSYSVGEVRMPRGPGRREIGHGKLAERALKAMLPEHLDFPYTVRVTSDILESNGSSSMATVCGGSVALFDAGVPMKKAVAGVAMGLVKGDDDYVVLTDILGDEDHAGDMDFKVCGTSDGITALQMDIKCKGLTREIMQNALNQAKEARIFLLGKMSEAIAEPRPELSPNAPKIVSFKIDVEKIGAVIGQQGKVIRKIQEETGTTIEIEEDGTVKIFATKVVNADKASEIVHAIIEDPEVGKTYKGKVVSVRDFGAIVEFLPGKDGLCHISELAEGFVDKVTDIVKEGDELDVIVIDVDPQGKVKLSHKATKETPEQTKERMDAQPRRNDRNDRGRGGRNDRNGGRNDRGRGGRNDRNDRDRNGGRNDRNRNDRSRNDERNDRDNRDGEERKPRPKLDIKKASDVKAEEKNDAKPKFKDKPDDNFAGDYPDTADLFD